MYSIEESEMLKSGTSTARKATGPLPSLNATTSSKASTGTTGGAGTTTVSASQSLKDNLKQSVCVTSLREGHIEAFCDLFTLAYRPPVLVDEAAEKYFSLTESELSMVSSYLCESEQHRRNGAHEESYECIVRIARFFEENKDYETSLYFYESGLNHARLSGESKLEGVALENIGAAYERLGRPEKAVSFHERFLTLAQASRNKDAEEAARQHLVAVYAAFSDQACKKEDFEQASTFMQKAIDACRAAGDLTGQSSCEHKLARIYFMWNKLDRAKDLEEKYFEACMASRNYQGAVEAVKSLSEMDDGVEVARKYLRLAVESGDVEAQCDAHTRLGMRLNRDGYFEEAIANFERNFLLSKKTGDRRRAEQARILFGLARGNANLGQFMGMVNTDVGSLIHFKNQKIQIGDKDADTMLQADGEQSPTQEETVDQTNRSDFEAEADPTSA